MAVVNLIPRAPSGTAVTYNAWTKTGGVTESSPAGATIASVWDDAVGSPDTTTYAQINNNTSKQTSYVDDFTDTTATINSVTLKYRAKGAFNGAILQPISILPSAVENAAHTTQTLTNAFVDYSLDITSQRPGGGSWVPADLASFQAGAMKSSAASNTVQITQFYVAVDYTPGSANVVASQSAYASAFNTIRGIEDAYVAGFVSITSYQASRATGHGTNISQVPAYVSGFAPVIVASQSAYTSAFNNANASQPAYVSGPTTLFSRGGSFAFAKSHDTSIGVSQSSVTGHVSVVNFVYALASGFGTSLGNRQSFVSGFNVLRASQAALSYGAGNSIGSRSARAAGYDVGTNITASQAAYSSALGIRVGSRQAYVSAIASIMGAQPVYVSATLSIRGSEDAYVAGRDSIRGSEDARVSAHATLISSQAAYVSSMLGLVVGQASYISGFNVAIPGYQSAYIQGPIPVNGSQSAYIRGAGISRIRHKITAIEGPASGSWAKLFSRIVVNSGLSVIRENISEQQILILAETFPETWPWAETITQTVAACSVPSTTLFPSTTLLPC